MQGGGGVGRRERVELLRLRMLNIEPLNAEA
jgi:hypothetical protein